MCVCVCLRLCVYMCAYVCVRMCVCVYVMYIYIKYISYNISILVLFYYHDMILKYLI